MNIIIYGNGDFGKIMYHYFKTDTNYQVVAFCADKKYISKQTFCELPLIAFENIEALYPADENKLFIAMGYSNMRARVKMYNKVKEKNYSCVNYISSKAVVDETLQIGENNVVFQNTVIEPFVKIGDNNIIWSSSNICHDVIISSHSFFSSQSLVGGFSIIKDSCFLGFNASIVHNIVLEEETLVGAKSLILSNTNKFTKYIGNPAQEVSIHYDEGIKIK